MKCAILMNTAIFALAYKKIAENLKSQGCDVTIITDSKFSFDKYDLSSLECPVIIFDEEKEATSSDVLMYDKWNVHSDFDRDNYYHSIVMKDDNYWGKISNRLYCFFDGIFKTDKFDFVFYENVSNGLAHTAFLLAKKHGIPYLGLTGSRLPGKALFSSLDSELADELNTSLPSVDDIDEVEKNEILEYISNIETIQPDYMKSNGLSSLNFFKKIFKRRDVRFISETIKNSLKYGNCSFQTGNPLLKSVSMNWREVKRWFCAKRINKFYESNVSNVDYYIYPLHYHPESSTSILAKYYDEFNLIKNIAFSLPIDKYLVVKDHISAFGYESFDFYKKIAELPNVILAHPGLNSKVLVKNSLGVFTLTSTVGYEAVLMNKPVVVFGDVFYMKHPLVYNCTGYRDIYEAIIFLHKNQDVNLSSYNLRFVASYRRRCFDLKINYNLAPTNEFVDKVCEQLMSTKN